MMNVAILQALLFVVVVTALTKPLGVYLYAVFETKTPPLPRSLGRLERILLRLCGVDPLQEQSWQAYALSVLLFGALGVLVSYAILRLQPHLPLNPQGMGSVRPDLAWNTAVSFATNTNWQSYSGESTLSHLSQMMALGWHNFTSAAVGIGVALALARGLTRRKESGDSPTLGNFWVDLIRALVYVLVPSSLAVALLFVSQGVLANFSSAVEIHPLEGVAQILPMGPVASQEVIKQLGTNGGGFFGANSAHPFENPTPLTNFLQLVLVFSIPAALTYTYGKLASDQKQGWVLFAVMMLLFVGSLCAITVAEHAPSAALSQLPIDHSAGNLEGKEVRFGAAGSALFATVTTAASCGAVNAMHDSFSPLGGLWMLVNIQLGEVIFGGVGAGLYGMLIFALLAVFVAGLMVGRTPEYLGKKIEAKEMTLAMLYVLIFPLCILGLSAWASVSPSFLSALGNAGPHGLTEILYAYSSGAGNNGSAFAGLGTNTMPWNITLGITMFLGRYFMLIPVLAIAGSMVGKKTVAESAGTFPTGTVLFAGLLVFVILILGALTFFPALSLGPILEHLSAHSGKGF